MGECAYCKNSFTSTCKKTKEHSISKCIVKSFADQGFEISYSPARSSVSKNYMTTNDVCGKCNNAMSDIDEAMNELASKYLFVNNFNVNEPLTFSYNYNSLARWLFKTHFNLRRYEKSETSIFDKKVCDWLTGRIDASPLNYSIYAGRVNCRLLNSSACPFSSQLAIFDVTNPCFLDAGQIIVIPSRETFLIRVGMAQFLIFVDADAKGIDYFEGITPYKMLIPSVKTGLCEITYFCTNVFSEMLDGRIVPSISDLVNGYAFKNSWLI